MRGKFVVMIAMVAACGGGQVLAQPAPADPALANPSLDDMIATLSPTRRGILPAVPVQAGAAAPEARTGRAPPKSVALTVDFVTGSASLTPDAERQLGVLGQALTSPALAKCRFRIEGHADTVGTPQGNKDLSLRRAQAVSAYLEQKFTIDTARLQPVGLGTSQLLVDTPDQTPEPRNRRVRVVNLSS